MAEPSNEPVMPSFANLTPMLQFPDVTSTTEPVMPTPVDLNLVNNSDLTSILVVMGYTGVKKKMLKLTEV